jgi:hypothetical protein
MFFVSLVLTLALASAAYAGLPMVIGDWEDGSTDGWSGGTPVQLIEADPVWPPPPGTGSYMLNNPPDWQQGVQLNSYDDYFYTPGNTTRAEFEWAVSNATDLHLCVKMVASEWTEWFAAGGWVNAIDAVVINGDFGWTQFTTPSWFPQPAPKTPPPPYYRDWDGMADEVFHYDWIFPALGPTSYVQMHIITNYGGAPEGTPHGNFYVDKLTLTPEPATNPATNPNPADGAGNVSISANLLWSDPIGYTPTSYDVYLGTDPSAYNNPKQTVYTNSYHPQGDLAFETTYYWVVNSNYDGIIYPGDVWSFTTTEVVSYRPYTPILGPNDFQGKVPDINDPNRHDPRFPDITLNAQICWHIWVARTAGGYPPHKDPNDPNNWIYEPNIPPRIEAYMDPNKSWMDPNHSHDPNLLDHEQGHLDIAQKAARDAQAEIDAGIKNGTLKGEGKTAADARKNFYDKIKDIINKHIDRHQQNYDTETEHGNNPEKQKEAREKQKDDLKPTQQKGPGAKSGTDHSCTYHPDFGLAFTDNLIEMVPDPLDPIIGAELIMPVFNLVGQTIDGEFFFQSEVGYSTVEIRKDNQTYLSIEMDYMLYSPTENMFYGLGMAFQSDMPEGISAYVDGVCQALTSKNTLTLYGVEIYPDANFMALTNGFTTAGECPGLINSGMRIVGSGLEADLNEDYRVDFRDFAILGNQWFQAPGYPIADISPLGGDGIVNFEDIALLADQWIE